MKKILLVLLATIIMVPTMVSAKTLEVTIGSENMYVSEGGVTKAALDAPAYIENGRTMVPIRVISENFGAKVSWDEVSRQVTIKKDATTIILTIDSDKAQVNGKEKQLDSAAVIKNGRTMVPLRFVSEELGRAVEYVPSTSQILISDEKPISVIDGVETRKYDYEFAKEYMFQTQVPDELLYEAVPYMNAFNEEIVLMAARAKAAGITLTAEEMEEIKASVLPDMENIYDTTLVAAIVKGLENYTYAVKYISTLQFDVSEEEVVEMYNKNYVCAKHILISTVGDDGQPISAGDKKLAREKAEYVLKRLDKGDSFDDLIEEYGEDPGMANYPDGYVFTRGEMVPEFENAVFDMRVDYTSQIIESDYGYHIIKRLPLPKISDQTKYNFLQQLNEKQYGEMLEKILGASDIQYNFTTEEIVNMLK